MFKYLVPIDLHQLVANLTKAFINSDPTITTSYTVLFDNGMDFVLDMVITAVAAIVLKDESVMYDYLDYLYGDLGSTEQLLQYDQIMGKIVADRDHILFDIQNLYTPHFTHEFIRYLNDNGLYASTVKPFKGFTILEFTHG